MTYGPMTRDLSRLLRPQSIAVVGGRQAAEVIRQCDRLGFAGPIYPIHPYQDTVGARRCYRSVAELPQAPDGVFIAVNRELTLSIVADLAAAGAGGAVCYAAGYKEAQSEDRQRALLDVAAAMPILGPNCHGLINYLDGVALWPDQHGGKPTERGVALLTQSGNMAINLTMQRRVLPLAYVVTLGNQAQIGLSEMIEVLLDDDRVSAIGLHIEGIDDPQAFEQAARRASHQGVPLVGLKTGRSQTGTQLTLSHTASLAGSDRLIEAFFARLGIARLDSLTALLEALKLLHVTGPLPGNRIASMSCSGGEAALMADAVENHDLCFPALSESQTKAVKATLSNLVTVSNPLDYHTFIWGDKDRLQATYSAMLRCGFDLGLLVMDFPRADRCSLASWQLPVDALVDACRATGARAALLATLPENLPEEMGEALMEKGIAPLQGVDDALAAVAAAAFIGRQAARDTVPAPVAVSAPIENEALVLDEWAAKQWLAEYGIPSPHGYKVHAAEAVVTAESIGFPVAVKACSEALAHKSEQGAVALNLPDVASVAQAVERMRGLSDAFIVESMITDGVAELIVGINRDPQFGLYLVIGSGGVLVELMGDSRVLLLPTSSEEITQALQSLRVSALLTGYRGRPVGDLKAAVAAVEAVGRFALEQADTLLELDINPLIVRPEGVGVIAVDALIRCVSRKTLPIRSVTA